MVRAEYLRKIETLILGGDVMHRKAVKNKRQLAIEFRKYLSAVTAIPFSDIKLSMELREYPFSFDDQFLNTFTSEINQEFGTRLTNSEVIACSTAGDLVDTIWRWLVGSNHG